MPTALWICTARDRNSWQIKIGYSLERLGDGVEVVHILQKKHKVQRQSGWTKDKSFKRAKDPALRHGQLRRPIVQLMFMPMDPSIHEVDCLPRTLGLARSRE